MSTIRLAAATATDAGRVRAVNEDKAIAAEDLVAIADGMGGHAGGEVAASTAVDALRQAFGKARTTDGFLAAVEAANRAVYERSIHERSLRGMGTTLTAAAVVDHKGGERVVLVNVGDSRAYLLDRSGFTQLTEDHSLVEEMVRRGEITPAQAAVHPHRHIVTRVLGIDESIEVDAWQLDPQPGWRLLLCSDGLTNECTDDELEAVLAAGQPPQETARRLVERALAHGGSDNVTVVVVDFVDGDEPQAATGDDVPHGAAAGPGTDAGGSPPAGGAGRAVADPGGAGARAGGEGAGSASSPVRDGRPDGWVPRAADPLTLAVPPARGATAGLRPPRWESSAVPRADEEPPRAERRPVRVLVPAGTRSPARAPVVRVRHERIMSFRVFCFLVLLVAVVGGSLGFVVWFVKASYFLGVADRQVVIYQGRPGGLLWMQPTVVERSTLTVSNVFPPTRPYLRAGMQEPSLDAARSVLAHLSDGSSYLSVPAGATGHANGVPVGPTLVPISSPVLTLPPAPRPTSAPSTTLAKAGGTKHRARTRAAGGAGATPQGTAAAHTNAATAGAAGTRRTPTGPSGGVPGRT